MISVGVLGPLELRVDGVVVPIGAAKPRAVLGVLALHANLVVSVADLVDAVWGDRAPEGAEHTLQQHVSALRKVIEPARDPKQAPKVLVTQPPGYSLRVDEVDAERFERTVSDAASTAGSGQTDAAIALLDESLSWWRGAALADLRGGSWFDSVAVRLDEQRLAAIEQRIDLLLEANRAAEVIGELEPLIAAHPFRERLRGQQMIALYRTGRQADALSAFQAARQVLADELGLEPSTALRDIEAAILAQDPALDTGGATDEVELFETFRTGSQEVCGSVTLPDGQVVTLVDGTSVVIGRSPDVRVRLIDSRVSRRHARLESARGRHRLEDLGSTNGTTVNGEPITSQVLEDGDEIGIGGVPLGFRGRPF